MHELALCQGVIDLIYEQQRKSGFETVKRVILEIGALGHVDPDALEFVFEVGAKGTPAEDAVLEIREVAGKAWCMECSKLISIDKRGEACPGCAGYQLIVQQGEEMRLKELEVT